MAEVRHFYNEGREEDVWFILVGNYEDITSINIYDTVWHREDGPAYIKWKNGKIYNEEWIYNDQLHRYDGPASLLSYHTDTYYIHGNAVAKNTYLRWLIDMGMDIENLTPEDKLLIDLKWKRI